MQSVVLVLMGVFTLASITLRTGILLSHRDGESFLLWLCPVLGGLLAWRMAQVGQLAETQHGRDLKILLLAGIILRALGFLDDLQDRPQQVSDWHKYEVLGQRLAFEGRYYDFTTVNGIELRAFRPPGLPLLLAAGYRLVDERIAPAAVMFVISVASLILGYIVARSLRNLPSLLLFFYLSVSPHVLTLASITNTHLLILLILLAVIIVRTTIAHPWIQSLITGGIVGAGALVRAEMLLLLVAVMGILVGGKASSLRRRLLQSGVVALAGFLVIVPWSFRNCRVLKKCALISTNSGAVLYSANVTPDFRRGGGYNGVGTEFYQWNNPRDEVELDSALRRAALKHIAQNSTTYLLSLPFRLSRLMSMQQWAIGYSERYSRQAMPKIFYYFCIGLEQILLWGLYLVAGIWLAARELRGDARVYLLSYGFIMSGYAFFFESLDRNHFPYVLMPLLAFAIGWPGESRMDKGQNTRLRGLRYLARARWRSFRESSSRVKGISACIS